MVAPTEEGVQAMMTINRSRWLHRLVDGAPGVHDQGDAPFAGPRHPQQYRGASLSAADLSKIWAASQRHRSEYLRSLVLGWLSRRARGDSELLSSTPETLCGTGLNVQHVEHRHFA